MDFYDVKTRRKVIISDSKVKKVKYTQKNGQVRYAFRGYTDDGRMLTKFTSKSNWDTAKGTAIEVTDEPIPSDEEAYLKERANRADKDNFRRAMAKVGDAEPEEWDQLPTKADRKSKTG